MTSPSRHDEPLKVSSTNPAASMQLAGRLRSYLEELNSSRRIVVVCLGTDRSTGDSLGPLVGTQLKRFRSPEFDLYGTLESPVHALNVDETLARIHAQLRSPFIIGIDACLGQASSVGYIHLGSGPVCPGSGVGKTITPVGDIHMTGVVNVGGFMEYMVLQNTRLHVVMHMSDVIARSVYRAVATADRFAGMRAVAAAAAE